MRQYSASLMMLIISTFYTMASFAGSHSLVLTNTAQCFSDPKAAYAYLQKQKKKVTAARQFTADHALVNINSATEGELTSLKGIGSTKAQEIILYREAFGDFKRVEELTLVKGIGDKTLAKNRHRLRVK